MVAAGFSAGEADMLRRAMSRSRSLEAMQALRGRFLQGAAANGIDPETAEEIFRQLEGFASYGFCKSHAASFALIAYQTLHLKRYHAPAFYCALLNQQPMGFYSSEVVIGDARRHGVELLPPDINRSEWEIHSGDPAGGGTFSAHGVEGDARIGRAGLGSNPSGAPRSEHSADLRDFCQRTRLPQAVVSNLIRAGVLDAFGPGARSCGSLERSIIVPTNSRSCFRRWRRTCRLWRRVNKPCGNMSSWGSRRAVSSCITTVRRCSGRAS